MFIIHNIFLAMLTVMRFLISGLGNMGLSMATNLQGFLKDLPLDAPFHRSLYVYNRTQSKADILVSEGATLAPQIAGIPRASTVCLPRCK
jgi:3-hydroxyisobutyrate dehydrogenase-like beta-hydroxyacid dehydrogenase